MKGLKSPFFLNSNLQNKIYKYTSPQVIESTFYIPKQASDGSVSQHGNAEEEMEIKSKKNAAPVSMTQPLQNSSY